MMKFAVFAGLVALSAAQIGDDGDCGPPTSGCWFPPADVLEGRPADLCLKIDSTQVPDWFNPAFHCAGIEVLNDEPLNNGTSIYPLNIDTWNPCTDEYGSLTISSPGRFYVGVPTPGDDGCNVYMQFNGPEGADRLYALIRWGVVGCPN